MNRKVDILTLQATPFCNLDCKYCYLPDKSKKISMSLATVEKTFERLLEANAIGKKLRVSWHAGEPLSVPIEFYRKSINKISEILGTSCQVTHSFQSNGTLLTKVWCDFIKEKDISIGLSCDGDEELHNSNRVYRNGKGSHARLMEGVKLLQDAHIDFSVIAVVTSAAIRDPRKFLQFFIDNKILALAFNAEEVEGVNSSSSLEGKDYEYKLFLNEIARLIIDNNLPISIREFAHAREFITGNNSYISGPAIPLNHTSVSHSGDFSTFSPELLGMQDQKYGNFIFGNVYENSFKDMFANENFKAISREIEEGVTNCRTSCEFFEACGGGNPSNKYYETGSFAATKTLNCVTGKMLPLTVYLENVEKSSTFF